jgi:hypothetical protein
VRKRGKKREEEEEEARADEVRIDGERARDRREEGEREGTELWLAGWLPPAGCRKEEGEARGSARAEERVLVVL